jgi:DNA-binding response OmpR family regulator
MRILAVEDEPELARLLLVNLSRMGFATDHAACVEDAHALLDTCSYDLVLLDVRLPDGSGVDLLRQMRARRQEVPVILLPAADSVDDRVAGLGAGADDYVTKPFALEELVARMRAVLRRPGRALSLTLTAGNICFNSVTREVCVGDRHVALARRELAALESLMRADGRVVTREALEEAIYGLEEDRQSNVLESTLSRLRRRLEAEGAKVGIRVMRGVGYRITAEPTRAAA